MRQRVVVRALRGPVEPEQVEVQAQAVRVGGETEILARLRHRHVGHAPAQAGLAAEIGPPHEMLRLLRPVGVLLHRQLARLGRAQVEVRHAGDDDVVVRHDAEGRVAGESVGVELHVQFLVRETLLQHPRERVGETHVAVGLRDALVFHAAAEAPRDLLAIGMIPGETVRADAVAAGVAVVRRDVEHALHRIFAQLLLDFRQATAARRRGSTRRAWCCCGLDARGVRLPSGAAAKYSGCSLPYFSHQSPKPWPPSSSIESSCTR